MQQIEAVAVLFVFAMLRYLPVIALPSLSPLSWAPGMVRMALLFVLALLSVTALPEIGYSQSWLTADGLLLASLSELLIGLVFSLAIIIPQAAIGFSMRVADIQAGFSAASMFNPAGQHEPESLLGSILMLAATVLFFILDLHLLLFQALMESMKALPLGQSAIQINIEGFMSLLGSCFLLGLAIAAPIIVGLFGVDIGIAYATRSMPQANVYFLALPLKVIIALLLLAMVTSYLPVLITALYQGALFRIPSALGEGT